VRRRGVDVKSKPSESRRLAARLLAARDAVMLAAIAGGLGPAVLKLERAAIAVGRHRGLRRGRR
jgi:hypothetical protein